MMRQILIFTLAFILLFILFGCSDEKPSMSTSTITPTPTPAQSIQTGTPIPRNTPTIKTVEKLQPDYEEYMARINALKENMIDKIIITAGYPVENFESQDTVLIVRWMQLLKQMKFTPIINPDWVGGGYALMAEVNHQIFYLGSPQCYNDIMITSNTSLQIDNYFELQYELMELERLTTGQALSTEMTR